MNNFICNHFDDFDFSPLIKKSNRLQELEASTNIWEIGDILCQSIGYDQVRLIELDFYQEYNQSNDVYDEFEGSSVAIYTDRITKIEFMVNKFDLITIQFVNGIHQKYHGYSPDYPNLKTLPYNHFHKDILFSKLRTARRFLELEQKINSYHKTNLFLS